MKFIRDQYPQARLERIYDASVDGWGAKDFHRCCDKKGWTITIVYTTKDFIFGGFTTAEWKSPPDDKYIFKRDSHSFLFSVNEGSKYHITSGDRNAIVCHSGFCAGFGGGKYKDLFIKSDSNKNTNSFCHSGEASFNLPIASGFFSDSITSSINGGSLSF